MRADDRGSLLGDATRGAIAGGIATWLMDLVTTGLLQSQSEETTAREEAARPNGKGALDNLIDRVEATTRLALDPQQRSLALQVVHFGLGIVPGALYGALRGRVPVLGARRGLAYGVLLWALNDEYLNTALGLAGPFEAYPLRTHWRGFVGHVVLGAATDAGIDILA